MIRIVRGHPPKDLAPTRARKLRELRRIARTRAITSDDIKGYRLDSVCDTLWQVQHRKCCYCEMYVRERYNDVEHYRPKGRAERQPGSTDTHGYWWLAYTWKNLLFACAACNRSGKRAQFPLAPGSIALMPEKHPPGNELPYLLNPAADNPIEHIEFHTRPGTQNWYARPRNGSVHGNMTIRICDLNHQEVVELRTQHVEDWVRPYAGRLQNALKKRQRADIDARFREAKTLLTARRPFVAATYDALCQLVPSSQLKPWNRGWPARARVPLRG